MKTPLYIGTGVVGLLLGFVFQAQIAGAQESQIKSVSVEPIQFVATSQSAPTLGNTGGGSCGS